MPLSWNEIRNNAIRFSKEWGGETRERAEAQSFWNDFFTVFGLQRRLFATFEEPVRKLSGDLGAIDLFWPGVLLIEHKSRGKDLSKAESQALAYIRQLNAEGKQKDLPRYVIVSDFDRIALHDLEPAATADQSRVETLQFAVKDLHNHIKSFAFIPGYKQETFEDPTPINGKAVRIMGKLHDALDDGGYKGHDLERFLVRILFCLFADVTGIFERDSFRLYVENLTGKDGSDLGPRLAQLFEVLNTSTPNRQKKLDETLASFPYVNGGLYEERLRIPDFDGKMREALLEATRFDWGQISPAIFGALFQSIMLPRERRQLGAHYTSERDILKVVRGLFLDNLREEYGNILMDRSTRRTERLKSFHEKISNLKFLDPACGCGNFLVITYRELRQLEIDLLKELYGKQRVLDVRDLSKIDVDAFYGIEIEEWPTRIAEVAMWLMDHQMNIRLSEAFGQYYQRLPLKKSPTIVNGNSLRINWQDVLPKRACNYVLGNPPFVGKHLMKATQAEDMKLVCGKVQGSGVLDYVTAWYFKAAEYMHGTKIECAFVSTNSITQGEQVGPLWNKLFQQYGAKIHFAHRTFTWTSEARGKAHVHVVIIGFGFFDKSDKKIYDYEADHEHPHVSDVKNISPYLIQGSDMALISRSKPIVALVPECQYGNKPSDGGFLIVEEKDRKSFLAENPKAAKYLRPLLCAEEYLYGLPRWCLWLVGANPQDIRDCKGLRSRIEAVRVFRLASKKEPTRRKAEEASLFAEIRQPTNKFIVIPQHTSEARRYIPFCYFGPEYILHNSCTALPGATMFHFGIISSTMHMAWVKQVCGRLESRYRYSHTLVYNNFPWPETDDAQKAKVEELSRAVLAARQGFLDTGSPLVGLYDALAMPSPLLKAHQSLDRAVEKCYRAEKFANDRERVEYLFQRYETLIAPLLPKLKRK